MRPTGRGNYLTLLTREAEQRGLPPAVADAVARVESGYDPSAIGKVGEFGLMQVRAMTAEMLGHRGPLADLFVPETNIRYGVEYLARAWQLARRPVPHLDEVSCGPRRGTHDAPLCRILPPCAPAPCRDRFAPGRSPPTVASGARCRYVSRDEFDSSTEARAPARWSELCGQDRSGEGPHGRRSKAPLGGARGAGQNDRGQDRSYHVGAMRPVVGRPN